MYVFGEFFLSFAGLSLAHTNSHYSNNVVEKFELSANVIWARAPAKTVKLKCDECLLTLTI